MDLNPTLATPAPAGDLIAQALDGVRADDPAHVTAALALVTDAGLPLHGDDARAVLAEALGALLGWAANPTRLCDALTVLAGLSAPAADTAFNLLIAASFPQGEPEMARLSDAAVLVAARLVAAMGQPNDAIAMLAKAAGARAAGTFMPQAHKVRAHILGLSGDLVALWPALAGEGGGPLDPQYHRATARRRAAAGDHGGALDALLTGASLPAAPAAKTGTGGDLAAIAVYAATTGQDRWLGREARLRHAFAACPTLAAEAAATLAQWPTHGAHGLYGAALRAPIAAWFSQLALAPPPAYPLRNGKPHADVVWLEITNFCNQTCTFCPDMHREAARQWQPLDQVKTLIDQLAAHVSVGSLQLNAYGEPLLHPQIGEILAYLRAKQVPWPTYFTTHGLTLVPKKLKALSGNWPTGIRVSLHNDSQDSYARTRSARAGDYPTLVRRLSDLLVQMVDEAAPTHVFMYQMVCNGEEDPRVPAETRAAFPDSPERLTRQIRAWEAIAARIAEQAPPDRHARAITHDRATIAAAFAGADQTGGPHLPVLAWTDLNGAEQYAFLSTRAVSTYGNLVLEYHPDWTIRREVVTHHRCGFVPEPSLAIFATGRLGICCIDLNSTGTFGHLSDFADLGAALRSDAARRIFAELSNNVATSAGCQICLASGAQLCGPSIGTPIRT